MQRFVYGKANVNYNVNEDGWVTDYNVGINETLHQWETENMTKQLTINKFFNAKENFTEEVLLNLLNDLITGCSLNSYAINKAICLHKRSFTFIKNIYELLKSRNYYDAIEFIKDYVYYGNMHKEILSEFSDDIIENISYFRIDKDSFYTYMIPFFNDNVGRFDDEELKTFLYRNMHNFDFDYDEIKRLLPSFEDDNLIFLTNNMPLTIANSILERNTINNVCNKCLSSAYFSKNPDNVYIANNIDNIISIYGSNSVKDYTIIFEHFVSQSDNVFIKLFLAYKNNKIINKEKVGDIFIYERYINLIGTNSTNLEDIQLCFDDKIFECHKRLNKIELMYLHERECLKNLQIQTSLDIFSIENRQNVLDSITSSIDSIEEDLEKDKKECLDILKNDQNYFFIDKKIKTYEFNKCKLSSEKFEGDINVFYTKNNSYEKQCTLKEFLEELFNIEINSKKKSSIPENLIKEFVECVFRGKITNNKDCSYILKIDIDLSEEDFVKYILNYRISADNKRNLNEKNLQDFLVLN